MAVSGKKEDSLCLPQNLTVRSVAAVRDEILHFMEANHSATLEIPDGCQADISFIQLIEAARVHAAKAGKPLRLAEPATGSVLEVLGRAGFLEALSAEDSKFWLHQGITQ